MADKPRIKPKPPLVLDRTYEMLAPPDPAAGASCPGMPNGPSRVVTFTQEAAATTSVPQPRKGYRPPHGTEYTMTFDATTDTYTGRMIVPGHPQFPMTAHGRRELYRNLDRAYLKAQEAKETT